jgi:hypothetical protein
MTRDEYRHALTEAIEAILASPEEQRVREISMAEYLREPVTYEDAQRVQDTVAHLSQQALWSSAGDP